MSRLYAISFTNVAVSAAQDLFEIIGATGKPFILHEVTVSQDSDFGDAAAEGLSLIIKRATAGYTTGSGGTTPTPGKLATNDGAAGSTAKVNNTTVAVVGSGTLTTLRADGFNVQGGYQYLPTPETRMTFLGGEAAIVTITAPADALTMSGTAIIEEL
jgi:hypothetical protein